jgi:TolA-binding protein
MIAVAAQKPTDTNNWVRWAVGLIVTIILALVVHIGNEGSDMKKRLAAIEAVQAAHQENQRQTEKKIDRIESKIDILIEKK